MFRKSKAQNSDERLDVVGRALTRAATASQAETDAAATSPFLYARVKARIASERERRESGEGWLAMLMVLRRSIPAMALVTVIAFGLFLFTMLGATQSSTSSFIEDVVLDGSTNIERVVFAERRPLSHDEVLTTVLNKDEQGEASR